jgi:hypothetical protein
VLVARGWEAGGNSGWVATMVLVPQVVDLAGDVPVLAGVGDGRGLAAALALGAQGVMVGTRFLASAEKSIDPRWKNRILASDATDVKVPNSELVMPPFTLDIPSGEPPAPMALRIRDWSRRSRRIVATTSCLSPANRLGWCTTSPRPPRSSRAWWPERGSRSTKPLPRWRPHRKDGARRAGSRRRRSPRRTRRRRRYGSTRRGSETRSGSAASPAARAG